MSATHKAIVGRTLAAFGAVAALGVAGCGDVPTEAGSRLRLQFSPLFLSGYGATRFDVALLNGPWTDSAPAASFEAKCASYSTDGASIGPLPTGENLTVVVTFYSDDACTTPVLHGARGGITINDGDTELTYFVPVFPNDGFRAFPQFDPALRTQAAAVSCAADADCRVKNPDGTYQLSPVAHCTESKCTIPDSAYPLDMSVPRAFHTATVLDDGRIALIGGVTRLVEASPAKLFGTDETVEVFDPVTFTFKTLAVSGFTGQRMAMHAAVALPGGRVGIYGGARELDLDFHAAGQQKGLTITVPATTFASDDNVSNLATTLDLSAGTADTGTLPSALVGLQASLVGETVLVTGGDTVKAGTLSPTAAAIECTSGAGTPSCKAKGQLAVARTGHCSYCADTACASVVLFGGNAAGGAPADILAEVWSAGGSTLRKLGGSLTANVTSPTCVGGLLVGGVSGPGAPASVTPATLVVSKTVLTGNEIKGLDTVAQPFRVYPAAVTLADGSTLVTGGVDADGRALNTAYRITKGKVTATYTMAAARFGHTATRLTTGPLAGAVLVAGGLTTDDTGAITVQTGAEIFLP